MSLITCDHCGLPVPAGLIEDGAEHQFCCSGCKMAWQIIHEHGFDGYYDLRERLADELEPALGKGRAYAEFDDPAFAERYVRLRSDGMATVELYLEGIHCAACVWLVERVPVALPGVADIRLDLGKALAIVTWNPEATPLSVIARFLDGIGYPPHAFRGVRQRHTTRRVSPGQDSDHVSRFTRTKRIGACSGSGDIGQVWPTVSLLRTGMARSSGR